MPEIRRRGAILLFAAASSMVALGVVLAAQRFPGGFDWVYTVISRLASHRRNPEGAAWLAGSVLVAVGLLWPVVGHLERKLTLGPERRPRVSPRVSLGALRMGLLAAGLLGVEGVLDLRFSTMLHKAHEALAILAFLGFYGGVLGLHLHRVRHAEASPWPPLLVVLPLVAVGITQLALYFDQRDLGWVDTEWRLMGIPFWLSFAFWQWLAVAFLALGLGWLVAVKGTSDPHRASR